VVPLAPEKLKENKIVSLFHEEKVSDQMKSLRTQVLNRLEEMKANSLLITSANPGEGKTFTSINLAISISHELDRTVMLVDTDLKRPTNQHRDFSKDFLNMRVERGLSDYLLQQSELSDLLVHPGFGNLTILPAGSPLPNSAELLGGPRMEALVNEMRSRYGSERIIIFDGQSLLTSPDALVLASYIDAVLLVVEAEKTTSKDFQRALELIQGKKLIGTVMNKIR
jgi:capsular exopolysaccharide synthesis family protein